MRGENVGLVRETVEVVLWHGRYVNDGKERLDSLRPLVDSHALFLDDLRLEGKPGDWRLVAKAHTPRERGSSWLDGLVVFC
jgi:hypothetical protein